MPGTPGTTPITHRMITGDLYKWTRAYAAQHEYCRPDASPEEVLKAVLFNDQFRKDAEITTVLLEQAHGSVPNSVHWAFEQMGHTGNGIDVDREIWSDAWATEMIWGITNHFQLIQQAEYPLLRRTEQERHNVVDLLGRLNRLAHGIIDDVQPVNQRRSDAAYCVPQLSLTDRFGLFLFVMDRKPWDMHDPDSLASLRRPAARVDLEARLPTLAATLTLEIFLPKVHMSWLSRAINID